MEALGFKGKVHFIRNNVDHYTGATFGCHENYSLERKAPLHEKNVILSVRTADRPRVSEDKRIEIEVRDVGGPATVQTVWQGLVAELLGPEKE